MDRGITYEHGVPPPPAGIDVRPTDSVTDPRRELSIFPPRTALLAAGAAPALLHATPPAPRRASALDAPAHNRKRSRALIARGDIVLLRFESGAERSVSPVQSGDTSEGETADIQPPVPPAVDKLAQVIHDLNTRHGSELGNSDRVILEAVLGGMSTDDELVQEAKVNSKENFLLVFSGPCEEEVMKTRKH